MIFGLVVKRISVEFRVREAVVVVKVWVHPYISYASMCLTVYLPVSSVKLE